MEFNEYQQFTNTTAKYPKELGIYYTALGLAGEAGEYCEKIKKIIRDNDRKLDQEKRMALIKELGDVLWYVAQAAENLGVSLETVANNNKVKLESRKERGKLHGSGDNR